MKLGKDDFAQLFDISFAQEALIHLGQVTRQSAQLF